MTRPVISILALLLGTGPAWADDHGDRRAAATLVSATSTTQGHLDRDDRDMFRIDLPAAGALVLSSSGGVDTVGRLENHGGARIVTDNNSGDGGNFRIARDLEAGTYYLMVRGRRGATGAYTLAAAFTPSAVEEIPTPPPPTPPTPTLSPPTNMVRDRVSSTLFRVNWDSPAGASAHDLVYDVCIGEGTTDCAPSSRQYARPFQQRGDASWTSHLFGNPHGGTDALTPGATYRACVLARRADERSPTVCLTSVISAPANAAPTVAAIGDRTLTTGDSTQVTVSVSDRDSGDRHTIHATTSDGDVASVAVVGLAVTVTGVAVGAATITVTATDSSGSDNATSAAVTFTVTVEAPGWVSGVFQDASLYKDFCAVPRSDPDYNDMQGTTLDENNWLRSWSNDTYLWYDEIDDVDPACCETLNYFHRLKTKAQTPSGRAKDRFHFTYDTQEWRALTQSGVTAGYGAKFVVLQGSPPRDIRVAFTEPNSPATSESVALVRGTRILAVDGVDAVNGSDIDTLNAGLRPNDGESHEFTVQDPGESTSRTVTMTAGTITKDPVQHVRVLDTDTGQVGYMLFNDHVATAESQLIDAVQEFSDAGVTDLVLDLRYNGGGRLSIANRMAAMIAGAAASGRVFEELQFNDKHRVFNPVTGRRLRPYLFATTGPDGDPLPGLNLSRVFVLTGPRTCSASESIINGLRGIDVEVVLIGATTCGKPYGFYATDNCGTTYFTVQIKGVNAKGFGDFTDGFSPANVPSTEGVELPGCVVADDLDHPLGDPAEGRMQAALHYRQNGSCPAATSRSPRETVAKSVAGATGAAVANDFGDMHGLKIVD